GGVVLVLRVGLGGNVLAPGQHQAVEELVERPERRSTVGGRQQHRNAAGFLDRDDVRLVEKGATGAELGRHDRRRETNPGRSHGRHANIPWLTCQNADSRLTPAPSCVAITSYPLDGAASRSGQHVDQTMTVDSYRAPSERSGPSSHPGAGSAPPETLTGPAATPHALRPDALGLRHAVAAGNPLAALAAHRILEAGGNAVYAGVAPRGCLGVVHSDIVNFAGVAPIMVYETRRRQVTTISGLGVWPRAATIDYFRDRCGGDMPDGLLRTVVPAAPDAWITALEQFGTLGFAE